jgi:two-component sensor histidine kinase
MLRSSSTGKAKRRRVGNRPTRAAQRQQPSGAEKLNRELNHRLRNVFSAVLVIVQRTAAHYPQAAEYRTALERRLRAFSSSMALLDRCNTETIGVQDLVELELAPFQDGDNVLICGPKVAVERARAQDLAIVLHELTTNAVKHGSLGTLHGQLMVTWRVVPDALGNSLLSLEWVEQKNDRIKPPGHSGYGLALIRESGSILGGASNIEFSPEGFRYRLTMPAAGAAHAKSSKAAC